MSALIYNYGPIILIMFIQEMLVPRCRHRVVAAILPIITLISGLYLYVIQPANNLGDKLINLLLVLLCSLIVYLMGVIALPNQPTETSSNYQFTKNHD